MTSALAWLSVGTCIGTAALFIAREFWKRWRDGIMDALDNAVRRRLSRFPRQYKEFMLRQLRYIDLRGLATVGFYTPELNEVFVDLSLIHNTPSQISPGLLSPDVQDADKRHSIDEFIGKPEPNFLAILGAPGSGKTTLLRHAARSIYTTSRDRHRHVPILLYLRDHVATIVADLNVGLVDLLCGTLGRYASRVPPGWFEQRLHSGDCIVLLDGLDEVAHIKHRRIVARWVERQTQQYEKNDFVITSRPQGFRSVSLEGARVLEVRSFTHEQVCRFVRGWYLAVERHRPDHDEVDASAQAESAAEDLIQRLDAAPALYDLTVNPLLLTMIANVHRYRGALPGSRSDLYGEICEVMLWRRQEGKDLDTGLAGDKKELLLRGLAYTMMERRVRDVSRVDVLEQFSASLQRISTSMTAEQFLEDVCSSGLLVERRIGWYAFAHLTFQEYLAAVHVREKGLVHVLASFVEDIWWRETALLYTATSDSDAIVTACIESNTVTTLALAFDCVDQGSELAPELRKRLDEMLESMEDDPSNQRLVAAVLLTRRLRDLIRTSGGGGVSSRPINTALYQIAVADQLCRPLEGGTNAPESPVIGLWASDAVNYIAWVNRVIDGPRRYRLPTKAELDTPAVQRALRQHNGLSIWSHNGEDRLPSLWVPDDVGHPHEITAATLLEHVETDIRRLVPTILRSILLRVLVAVRNVALDQASSWVLAPQPVASGIAADVVHDLEWATILAESCDSINQEAPDIDVASMRDNARRIGRYHTRDRQRMHASVRGFALGIDDSLKRALKSCRDNLFDNAVALDVSVDKVFERDFTLDLTMGRVLGHDHDRRTQLTEACTVGVALSTALMHVRAMRRPFRFWADELKRTFAEQSLGGFAGHHASLASMPSLVSSAVEELSELCSGDPHVWAVAVAERFREFALPFVCRERTIAAEQATALRMPALCLAAEAAVRNAGELRDKFREIAACITLLERRADERAPTTEMLILARQD